MAKCKKNLTNLDYTVLAADDTCPKAFVKSKKELAAISFIQGPKEVPSQIRVVLPANPEDGSKWLVEKLNRPGCHSSPVLGNTVPVWNPQIKSYELDFGTRVQMASSKNMQLEEVDGVHRIIRLTFGKVDENRFILDFCHPLSAVQAFSIALASFDAL
jgi:hypothetical protein